MNNNNKNIIFHPIISSIQKVALYETKTKLYLIGSNNRETRFRLLTIDRTAIDDLKIEEDPNEIEEKDIRRFVGSLGYVKSISAYGILGFVKFLEGFYLILITKRTRCAFIGRHLIYTIKDTVMIRINESPPKNPHPFEQRYVRMFCNIDLRCNFYFSYSYDLTRTLQYNLSAPRFVGSDIDIEKEEPLSDWGSLTNNILNENERVDYAYCSNSRKRFVWNAFLLKPLINIVLKDWLVEVIHGYISQSNISIFGKTVDVCLIARRSTRFAGTRFLKRGANFMGDVANEVETEQIVVDGNRLCSFTQMRGSIPSHWSQDVSKIAPKPPISLDLSDPFAQTPAKHFERLLFHFGSPVIVLNLVKKREKRKHESILSKEIVASIKYLNQFLPPLHRMKYIHFDMARKSRGVGNVMASLADIAEQCVQQTGMFFKDWANIEFQTGLVRVNCVDCLDRTNTAQFAIGKCALAHQLHKLGFINPPKLEFDSDCITMLENLYEDHGDTLALQYGGSQLVHRIKTYRKTAAWASQGNDIMQTLSRYFSNNFSDTEKQHSINLFLGYYIPRKNNPKQYPPIWELQSDYYMHNQRSSRLVNSTSLLTDWIRHKIRKTLPYSTSDSNKVVREIFRVHTKDMEMIDSYSNFHMSFKFISLEEHIAYQISQMARNLITTLKSNVSPFQPGRRRQDRIIIKNPSLSGQSSTSSTSSSTSSSAGEDTTTEDESKYDVCNISKTEIQSYQVRNVKTLLYTMEDIYGCQITNPSSKNLLKYKKYVHMAKQSTVFRKDISRYQSSQEIFQVNTSNIFGFESCNSISVPKINPKSLEVYKEYINSVQSIYEKHSEKDMNMLRLFAC